MRRIGLVLGIAAALAVLPTFALAQASPDVVIYSPALERFHALDTDGNGAVSAAEFAQAHETDRSMLALFDRDGDCTITREEFTGGGPRRTARFALIDADRDGRLSAAEIEAYVGDAFRDMDDDDDGQISQSEFIPGHLR